MVTMPSSEYARMFAVEEKHWWYQSLRRVLRLTLTHYIPSPARVLDAGCGTGRNLLELQRFRYRPSGIDLSSEAVAFCQERGLRDVVQGTLTSLPYKDNFFAGIISCDVLGTLANDQEIIATQREFYRTLQPNGILVVHCAAFPWLRSSHDKAVNNRIRFTKDSLSAFFPAARWTVEHMTYRYCLLFPIIAVTKWWKRYHLHTQSVTHGDTDLPNPIINSLLNKCMYIEDRWSAQLPLPFGSSVFAIFRKRSHE